MIAFAEIAFRPPSQFLNLEVTTDFMILSREQRRDPVSLLEEIIRCAERIDTLVRPLRSPQADQLPAGLTAKLAMLADQMNDLEAAYQEALVEFRGQNGGREGKTR
jgi:hypothetical protein